jgi:hypothetical protein
MHFYLDATKVYKLTSYSTVVTVRTFYRDMKYLCILHTVSIRTLYDACNETNEMRYLPSLRLVTTLSLTVCVPDSRLRRKTPRPTDCHMHPLLVCS